MRKGSEFSLKTRGKMIFERLSLQFPEVRCALNFKNVFELLVATILSAQCTDKRVNVVMGSLVKKYRSVRDFAEADLLELEEAIRSTGFYRNKAKNILAMSKMLVADFKGKVPDNMADLVRLPGVGRKTANVILGVGFGKNEGVVVDTHVGRIAQRLGLSKEKSPEKIEQDLMKILPREQWRDFALLLISHGRATCKAQKPHCRECVLVDICPASVKFLK